MDTSHMHIWYLKKQKRKQQQQQQQTVYWVTHSSKMVKFIISWFCDELLMTPKKGLYIFVGQLMKTQPWFKCWIASVGLIVRVPTCSAHDMPALCTCFLFTGHVYIYIHNVYSIQYTCITHLHMYLCSRYNHTLYKLHFFTNTKGRHFIWDKYPRWSQPFIAWRSMRRIPLDVVCLQENLVSSDYVISKSTQRIQYTV